MVADPKKDMNACEDFFELVTNAHILAAAMKALKMENLTDPLPSEILPSGLPQKEQSVCLNSALQSIIAQFVDISFPNKCKNCPKKHDHILEYAKETLTMGLMYVEFKDAVREGDGDRV